MSAESQQIFHQALYDPENAEQNLYAAAVGHLGASRSLDVITEEYAEATAAGDTVRAQALADELQPVRAAMRVVARAD